MEPLIELLQKSFTGYGSKIMEGFATLLVGWIFTKILTVALGRVLKRAGVATTVAVFCTNLAYVTMLTLVVITALDRFGFPTVSFAAVVGAAGLAIGLALKGTLSNFAAGVMLIAMQPFKVGDRIDAAGVSGLVAQIQVFATTVETADGKRVIIPNATIAGGNITNYSAA